MYRAEVLRGLLLGSEERAAIADIFYESNTREDAIPTVVARYRVSDFVAQHMADQLAGSHTGEGRRLREAELSEIEHELGRRGVAP